MVNFFEKCINIMYHIITSYLYDNHIYGNMRVKLKSDKLEFNINTTMGSFN